MSGVEGETHGQENTDTTQEKGVKRAVEEVYPPDRPSARVHWRAFVVLKFDWLKLNEIMIVRLTVNYWINDQ